ncbi:hypothetical protein OYC64_013602 [Pagothenia borchgrevinki]|uniref:Uncharacterized protein n=1 Tax=Pagothenia borchgrevinki TaxID=8213 RepID=A0ABD2FWP1_PAGBO
MGDPAWDYSEGCWGSADDGMGGGWNETTFQMYGLILTSSAALWVNCFPSSYRLRELSVIPVWSSYWLLYNYLHSSKNTARPFYYTLSSASSL